MIMTDENWRTCREITDQIYFQKFHCNETKEENHQFQYNARINSPKFWRKDINTKSTEADAKDDMTNEQRTHKI